MNTFEITIERKLEDSWPVTVRHQAGTSSMALWSRGEFIIDPNKLNIYPPTDRELGLTLGKALFRNHIRDALVRAVAEAKVNNNSLRVLLIIEADDLRNVHWEQLCAPFGRGWDYLLLNQQTPFSLYLPSQIERRFAPIGRRDLRALILVAGEDDLGTNYNLAPFNVRATVKSIRQSLGEIPSTILASMDGASGKPTLDNLCENLTAHHHTLLHIVCHGRYIRNKGETALYFPKDDNGKPVTASELIERLGRLDRLPHFTFLSTCESSAPEAENGLGGLGQRMVRELGMPAVLAMTDRITINTAEKLASTFYTQLREHGEADRALSEAYAGLQGKYDVTVPALYSRLGGQPLFSDTLNRPLTASEIKVGLSKFVNLLEKRAPILQQEVELLTAKIYATLETNETALSQNAKNERIISLDAINRFCIEICDLSFNALALAQTPPAYDARCPFRGLYPFHMEDREFFFGREPLIEKMMNRLANHPFLAVLGPSGSGKSSLVMAGLIPALEAQVAYLTPGSDPLVQLNTALKTEGNAIVVVDQFEELFTLTNAESKRKVFIERLLELTRQQRVVVTMRADFWGEIAPYKSLKEEMQAHQELIAPMESIELRSAIEQQASRVGLRFEADLSQTILDDVHGEPGAMPLLQHALLLLWNRRHGRWLRAEEYRATGGVQRAIARTADEAYRGFSEIQKEQVRDIFVRLTRLDHATAGGEIRDTRRRVELRELVRVGGDLASTAALVKSLADARLVVTSVNSITGHEEVEVAHEALIRYWPRLRGWLEEDHASLRLREGVREAALEWKAANHDESMLVHRGRRLEDVVQLSKQTRLGFNELEQEYMNACISLYERERLTRERRRQKTITLSILTSLILLALAVFGLNQASKAENKAKLARSGELAAQALYYFDRKLDLSLLLSVEAFRLMDTLQTQNSLFVTLSTPYLDRFLPVHTDSVRSVSFSPNGNLLASGGNDNSIILWDMTDLDSPRQLVTLHGHSNWVTSIAFSPDGKLLASGSNDNTIILWNLSNPAQPHQVAVLTGHSAPVYSIAFNPKGNILASGGNDNSIILWDITDHVAPSPLSTINEHSSWISSVAFSPDGNILASGGADQMIFLWDVTIPTLPHQLADLKNHTSAVLNVSFSPDGKLLATGSTDQTVVLWDISESTAPRLLNHLKNHSGAVFSIAFSPDGKTLATGGNDNSIILWNITIPATPVPLSTIKGHSALVYSLAFSPDGEILASGSADHTIMLWHYLEPAAPHQLATLIGHSGAIQSIAFNIDRNILASGSDDNSIILWDVSKPARSHMLANIIDHEGTVLSVAFSPDGKILASGSTDNKIIIWDVSDPTTPQQISLLFHSAPIFSVAFSADGNILASGSSDHTIILWNVTNPAKPKQITTITGHKGFVNSLMFSPVGQILASGGADKNIHLWDISNPASPSRLKTLTGHAGEIYSIAFSADGKKLASGSADTSAILWDISNPVTSYQLASLKGHSAPIFNVAFSPDGAYLASVGGDKTVMLWNLSEQTGLRQLVSLVGHKDSVYSTTFSPDGKILASGSGDGTINLWNVDLQSLAELACETVGRNFTQAEWAEYFPNEPYRETCPQLAEGK